MRQTKRGGGRGRDERRLVIDGHDRVERPFARVADDRQRRRVWSAEVDAQRAPLHQTRERGGALRSDDDLDIEPADGVEEVGGAIRRRWKEQQYALH